MSSHSLKNTILESALRSNKLLELACDRVDLDSIKANFVGPNGSLTVAAREIRNLSNQQKPAIGKLINQVKEKFALLFKLKLEDIGLSEIKEQLGQPPDLTLPCIDAGLGSHHPLA